MAPRRSTEWEEIQEPEDDAGPNPGDPADFDGDGTVGILDLLTLLANWGPC